ncbi:MAG: hypothetical protein HY924_04230 [Elusimicrobia bacterium]|nr:hypothetical protein [Elusimicrobiota bacterium]
MHSPEHEDLALLFESGELDEAGRADFERTMAGCAECRAFLESVRACHRLSTSARLTPRPELDEAVLESGSPRPRLLDPWTVAGVASSLVLAGALIAFLGRPAPRPADLAWSSGLEERVAAAGEELEAISESLGAETESGDIDDDLDALESAAEIFGEQG